MTAWLSEDVVYLCDHIKSIQYISGESPVVPHLSHSSLDYAVNTVHILWSSRIGECSDYQCKTVEENLPLIVPFSVDVSSSSKYCHFSVYSKVCGKYWSICKCVVVTYDTVNYYWFCQCKIKYCKTFSGDGCPVLDSFGSW